MESAACIANLLVDIKRKSSDSTIPADALAAALESFSRMRLERSSQAVKLASMICRQQVAQGPGRDVYVADLIKTTQEEWLARGLGSMAGAAKLEYLASSTRVDKYSQRVLEFQREARENTESAGSKDEGPQHFGEGSTLQTRRLADPKQEVSITKANELWSMWRQLSRLVSKVFQSCHHNAFSSKYDESSPPICNLANDGPRLRNLKSNPGGKHIRAGGRKGVQRVPLLVLVIVIA